MHEPDLHVVREDDAEMHGVDAEGREGGTEDRHHEQQRADDLKKAADDQEQDVGYEQELPGTEMLVRGELHDLAGDAGAGHPMSEDERGRDDQHDDAGRGDRLGDNVEDATERKPAINADADKQRRDRGHRRRLGDGHKAAIDAAEHDRGHRHRRQRAPGHAQALAEGQRSLRREVLHVRIDQYPDEECAGLQQAGQDAGKEEARHRLLRHNAVENERERGRDHDADRT